jgi:hypothetical protein
MKMKLRFNNGTVQTCQGNIGCLFVAAGLAQEIFDTPPALHAAWSAGKDGFNRPYIEVKRGSESMRFLGPKAENPVYFGEKCPADVAALFQDLLKQRGTTPPKTYAQLMREQEEKDRAVLKARGQLDDAP